MSYLSFLLPVVLSLATSLAIDRYMERRRLLPPNFRAESDGPSGAGGPAAVLSRQRAAVLRTAGIIVVAIVLAIGIFAPLAMVGSAEPPTLEGLSIPDLFTLHAIFVVALVVWFLLGFAGTGAGTVAWRDQLGFSARNVVREVGIGAAAGVIGWLAVIALLLLVAMVVYFVGGEDALPTNPPELIGWVVALPITVRLAISLSAGVVEETFFRGFLQPRIGIVASSVLFVLAHLSYDQPFLLVGVALLSILFALLVRWRQSIWAAVVAHTVFDAIQLLFVIPSALDMLENGRESGVVALLSLLVPAR